MNITFSTIKLAQPESAQRVFGFFNRCWGVLQERRRRAGLQAALSDLTDRELHDIGIARGEIDYVASNSSIDPRYIDRPVGTDQAGQETSPVTLRDVQRTL